MRVFGDQLYMPTYFSQTSVLDDAMAGHEWWFSKWAGSVQPKSQRDGRCARDVVQGMLVPITTLAPSRFSCCRARHPFLSYGSLLRGGGMLRQWWWRNEILNRLDLWQASRMDRTRIEEDIFHLSFAVGSHTIPDTHNAWWYRNQLIIRTAPLLQPTAFR